MARKFALRKEFTIKKEEWGYGGGLGNGMLRDPNTGKMCCLGIYLKACGVPVKDLENKSMPSNLAGYKLPEWLVLEHDPQTEEEGVASKLADANDKAAGDIDMKTRKKIIRQGFADNGVKVTFA